MLLVINNSNRNPKIKEYLLKQNKSYSKLECALEKKKDAAFPLYVTDTLLKILRELKVPYKDISTTNELLDIINTKEPISGIIITGSELKLSRGNIPDKLLLPSMLALKHFKNTPKLGICFGFQMINHYYGGKLESMDEFMKGTKLLQFNNSNSKNINKISPFFTKKYNGKYSLMHGDHLTTIGRGLVVTAEKNDVVYAIEHKKLPIIGVQFHPELAGRKGKKLLTDFVKLCFAK
jgi:GMP synthase-like glutamine amidotransferase